MDIVERVKAILLTPKTEWAKIDREPGDTTYLFTNYVAKLAAIPAVCGFLGRWLVGVEVPVLGIVRQSFFGALVAGVVQYVLAFVVVYTMALIVDGLAPTFNAQKNQASALKLSTYSLTPAWLAGIFSLLPGLRGLGILGLYGLYLFWLGVPTLMKAPQDKALLYTIAVVVCGVVLSVVASFVVYAVV